MPAVTPVQLKDRVRDYADQPDDGDGAAAYVTDTMIYERLTQELRKLVRIVVRAGVYPGLTTSSTAAAASISLSDEALCILNVSQDIGQSRTRLQRLVDSNDPYYPTSTTIASFWQPKTSLTALPTISIFPTPTTGTLRVTYVPEPTTIVVDTPASLYLPQSWQDAIILGAAMRCYVREDGSNAWLSGMYREALEEVEYDAAHHSGADAAVVRNSDAVYTPGQDQSQVILDPADFWYSP